tara:strand:+ start:4235 stop:4453 length:219 start_codon:yes stop_codon:yes gene_type:complete
VHIGGKSWTPLVAQLYKGINLDQLAKGSLITVITVYTVTLVIYGSLAMFTHLAKMVGIWTKVIVESVLIVLA